MRTRLTVAAMAALMLTPTLGAQDLGARIREANEHLLNMGHVNMAAQFIAPNHVVHTGGQDLAGGIDLIQGYVTGLRTAFPDLRVDIQILMVQGDRVTWLRTARGTHRGEYMGVAPTNRMVTWQDMVVSRFEGDRIAEEWGVSSLGEVLRTPAPAR